MVTAVIIGASKKNSSPVQAEAQESQIPVSEAAETAEKSPPKPVTMATSMTLMAATPPAKSKTAGFATKELEVVTTFVKKYAVMVKTWEINNEMIKTTTLVMDVTTFVSLKMVWPVMAEMKHIMIFAQKTEVTEEISESSLAMTET